MSVDGIQKEQSLEDAIELANKGHYVDAMAKLEEMAKAGKGKAALLLANMLELGMGDLQPDLRGAEAWYENAVEHLDSAVWKRYARFQFARTIIERHDKENICRDDERLKLALKTLDNLADDDSFRAILYLGLYHIKCDEPNRNKVGERLLLRCAAHWFVIALIELSRLEFRRHNIFGGVVFRLRAIAAGLFWIVFDYNNDRLFLVRPGCGWADGMTPGIRDGIRGHDT